MLRAPPKDPAEERFYGADWSDELGDDEIRSSAWAVSPAGGSNMIVFDSSFTDTTSIVWVAGGVAGTEYQLTNTIETRDGQTRVRTLLVYCDAR